MKKTILTIAISLFLCALAAAESSVWKVQKDNSVLYLGGTCHVLRDADYPLPAEFDKAYKASEVLVLETDIGKLNDPSFQKKLMSQAVYTDGSTVDQHLSAEAYSKLNAYFTANGIPPKAFRQLKPSMIIVTLTSLELMKLGVTQEGVDSYYYIRAKGDKKPVEGLETMEEQVSYIVSMADGYENDFVIYSMNDMESVKSYFDMLIAAWRKGDVEKLNGMMVTELKTSLPLLYKRILSDRNNRWLPLIDAYLKSPRTEFVLVGAAHLVGPDGIIATLKRQGYSVEKL